jgi:MFS family permease
MIKGTSFTVSERKITGIAAFIIALRLLGLFMVLPVFSIYALGLMYANPVNVGITLGMYGLAAMVMQLVFGYLSDRYGRIKMIITGLILFIAGSLIGAFAVNIYTMMLARFLQGSGALGSVILALISDHTRPLVRSQALAAVSVVLALGFMMALILGPILALHFGLAGLFSLTAFLGLIALNLTIFLPRNTPTEHEHLNIHLNKIKPILANKTILLLNISIFLLNALLIATFVVLPSLLLRNLYLSPHQTWWLYLVSLAIAFVLMLILLRLTEKFTAFKTTIIFMILTLMLSELIFFIHFDHLTYVLIALTLFFTGYLTLEALLPSWLSRIVEPGLKGTALGLFSSSQFFGAFVGGLVGAYFSTDLHTDMFLYLLAICVFWFLAVSADLRQRPK